MADTKISALTEMDGAAGNIPVAGDFMHVVDTSAGTNKKIDWDRVSPVINVMNYGATGDGATDDTAAIQAALDAIPAAGGTLIIPAGTYMVTGLTYITAGALNIQGGGGGQQIDTTTGAVLKLSQAGIILTIGDSTSLYHSGVHISDVTFDGGSFAASTGIKVLYRNSNYFENCVLNMFDGTGSIAVDFNGTTSYSILNTMMKCKIRKAETGVKLVYTTACGFIECYLTDGTTGISAPGPGDTLSVTSCSFDSWATAIDTALLGSRIMGCRFEGNTVGIQLAANYCNAVGNVFFGNTTGNGITISGDRYLINIIGNSYYQCATKLVGSNFDSREFSIYGGEEGLLLRSYATTTLADVTHVVNTSDVKVEGMMVFDSTANIPMFATGASGASTWVGEKAGSTITVSPV